MVFRVDRRKTSTTTKVKGKAGAKKPAGKVQVSKGGGEARVDKFGAVGRVLGGSAPSELISTRGPGERAMVPLTSWEKYDIDHDPMFREAATRMKAYKDLPDPWKRKVDEWGKKVSKEMKYALAKAIMKSKK
jgi:hypothetical protein